jgi:uncharacterized protein (DUF362 family)/Pyruvate/2-oxoacid:ferredoxin oxidoreductase delta subunit
MPYLGIAEVPTYDRDLIREVMAGVLDRSGLQWPGKKVLVKPNLLGPFPPDSAVVTHPYLIRALGRELRRRGCEVLVGDNPGVRGYGLVSRTAKVSGAEEASEGDFANISLHPRSVCIASRYIQKVPVSSEVMEADLLISLPKLKTHMATVITGAIKNSYGIVVGAEKSRFHGIAHRPRDFGELVVDIYAIRPPDLVIIDAVVGMEGNGPSAGNPRKIGYILSSDSGGAMDFAVCHMTGIDPSRVVTQKVAAQRGLAPLSLDEVDMQGELPVISHFQRPSNLIRLDPGGRIYGFVFRRLSKPQMKVDRTLCTACGTCERSCPTQAITMRDYPVFDYHACISCYCCYELCTEHAIKVGRLMHWVGGK